MKHVTQENDSGCGVACVAMLANKYYWEARLKILGRSDKAKHRTSVKEIRDGLKEYGLKMGKRHTFKKETWTSETQKRKFRAILVIRPRKSTPNWHWVVWDGDRVLDPLLKGDRYENALSYCRSYFEVSKP
jgi:ABC-type bacteriocin/lantibiotic exporter with double-glycine peptidase domain